MATPTPHEMARYMISIDDIYMIINYDMHTINIDDIHTIITDDMYMTSTRNGIGNE